MKDGFLPIPILSHLQEVFSNRSSFWYEHNYNYINSQSMISGYFSYLYPFRQRQAISSMEQMIDYLYQTLLKVHPIFQEANLGKSYTIYSQLSYLNSLTASSPPSVVDILQLNGGFIRVRIVVVINCTLTQTRVV
jgi:hypothetical protein